MKVDCPANPSPLNFRVSGDVSPSMDVKTNITERTTHVLRRLSTSMSTATLAHPCASCASGTHSGSEPVGRATGERNTDVDFEWPECGHGRAHINRHVRRISHS